MVTMDSVITATMIPGIMDTIMGMATTDIALMDITAMATLGMATTALVLTANPGEGDTALVAVPGTEDRGRVEVTPAAFSCRTNRMVFLSLNPVRA
ncbi:MAG: hypothetical protein A4E62_03062 [Syntrophorhabdus sp. PtaU1.Bin002]|nr:MAG: hypothetical protein A4E62_03062 [Syntrophorhabdus sp. PtaU1.Bin002]